MNTEIFKGTIKKVFFSKDNFAICLFEADDKTFTIKGSFLDPKENDEIQITGSWENNKKYGRQFKTTSYMAIMPSSEKGIIAYLGSGLLPGIGPATAEKIVQEFGTKAFDVLDKDPDKLISISGISEKKLQKLKEAWTVQRGAHVIMASLMEYGITMAYAIKIYKKYGMDALKKIEDNPFVLCRDIPGIGFKKADEIGKSMGFDQNHPLRIQSGILFALSENSLKGHVYCPLKNLISSTAQILEIDHDKIKEAFDILLKKNALVLLNGENQPVYSTAMYDYETTIAFILNDLNENNSNDYPSSQAIQASIAEIEHQQNIDLAEQQVQAVTSACQNPISIISGGPGTGKTTIISAICKAFAAENKTILMAAPTGRASKRMTESTGFEAKTIHRLLEYQEGQFTRNQENPLEGDIFIIDESSMIDTYLMYHFLNAVPNGAQIVFVGDIHQLPSVGPGNILKSMIKTNLFSVIQLTQIFRQTEGSGIIKAAHDINNGDMPELLPYSEGRDFIFLRCNDIMTIQDRVLRIAKQFPDSQVLTPMKKTDVGTNQLNILLQELLNPNAQKKHAGFAVKDKVLQIKNNYEKEVFNGDVGTIIDISAEDKFLIVDYGNGHTAEYDFTELDQLKLAYAMTIHKSQGSEYPKVIIPLTTSFYVMLARNLIYTGVTRGKEQVFLVGDPKALQMAVSNNKPVQRHTNLDTFLMENAEAKPSEEEDEIFGPRP
jgi:exodeoxyribonuclease V alpha subunit